MIGGAPTRTLRTVNLSNDRDEQSREAVPDVFAEIVGLNPVRSRTPATTPQNSIVTTHRTRRQNAHRNAPRGSADRHFGVRSPCATYAADQARNARSGAMAPTRPAAPDAPRSTMMELGLVDEHTCAATPYHVAPNTSEPSRQAQNVLREVSDKRVRISRRQLSAIAGLMARCAPPTGVVLSGASAPSRPGQSTTSAAGVVPRAGGQGSPGVRCRPPDWVSLPPAGRFGSGRRGIGWRSSCRR